MSFDKIIPRPLCHPEGGFLADGPLVRCAACQKDILNIVEYAQRDWDDLFYSSRLAQAFHAWTGNEGVPVTFPLVGIDGIYDTKVRGQSLRRMSETIKLLRAVNAPFTTNPSLDSSSDLNDDEVNSFFQKYMEVVSQYRGTQEGGGGGSNSDQIMEELMKGMYQMIQSSNFTNPFHFYFEKLVPFVLRCARDQPPEPLFEAVPKDDNLAKELLTQLQRSAIVRFVYGRYSIPFDIIHVMLGCYGCSSDVNAVGNWVLDLMARVCRGEYFWMRYHDNRFVKTMQHFLSTDGVIRRRRELYNVIKQIRDGEAAEILSAVWYQYAELQKLVMEKYRLPKQDAVDDPDLREMVMHQTFPAVLFQNHADQLGFMLALSHLLIKADFKRCTLQKGAFKKAKEIHKLVMRFVSKVEAFDRQRIPWTLDTLQLFLVSDHRPEEEIKLLMQLVLTPEEQ